MFFSVSQTCENWRRGFFSPGFKLEARPILMLQNCWRVKSSYPQVVPDYPQLFHQGSDSPNPHWAPIRPDLNLPNMTRIGLRLHPESFLRGREALRKWLSKNVLWEALECPSFQGKSEMMFKGLRRPSEGWGSLPVPSRSILSILETSFPVFPERSPRGISSEEWGDRVQFSSYIPCVCRATRCLTPKFDYPFFQHLLGFQEWNPHRCQPIRPNDFCWSSIPDQHL